MARDTARGLGLPSSIQLALYHVFESWVGGAAPSGLRGESIPIASRVARVAMEVAFYPMLRQALERMAAEGAKVEGTPIATTLTFDAVKSAGGIILKPIFAFPGGRRFHFRDPAGNEIAVWGE